MLSSFNVEYLQKVFRILQQKLSLLPHLLIYSIIYLYQYGPVNIYFKLWVIIQYYFIYVIAQIFPALATESSVSWLLGHFEILP